MKCKYCGAEMTHDATRCPACGEEIASGKLSAGKIALLALLVVIAVAVIAALVAADVAAVAALVAADVAAVAAVRGAFHVPIWAGKLTNRKARPPNAGLNTLAPIPPKNSLQTTMANKAPKTTIQRGSVGGKVSANKIPVTTAEQSPVRIT
jgi:hypothetical protein